MSLIDSILSFFQSIFEKFGKNDYICLPNSNPNQMSVVQIGAKVGEYTIKSLIKQNEYTETFKAVNPNGSPYFLKIYILKKTPAKLLDQSSHEVMEIVLLRKMQHTNLVSYINDGRINTGMGECHYVVTTYFTGEVLADKIAREGAFSQDKATTIFKGILEGLRYLHENNIVHNDITPANIMLSESMGGVPELIDMGHASAACKGTIPFDTIDLDPQFCANATSAGIFNERTDLFSAVAVLYAMLTGKAPWEMNFQSEMPFAQKILKLKRYRIDNPIEFNNLSVDDKWRNILAKGLSKSIADGYSSVSELIDEIEGRKASEDRPSGGSSSSSHSSSQDRDKEDLTALDIEVKKGSGRGFEDIAGMHELKAMLQQKVIFVLQNKELAEEYKLTPPNGMLLYGPPGCGKTFFAEKFAEQTGFSFILVKSSDLASVYVHGSQEKIGKLFKVAESNRPTVLCFDEFDAFVPNRSAPGSSYVSSEVNEFLSQLNNCSKRGIFVVATTNRPDMIDPAVLRTGRLDKHVYVPMPDHDARKEMFAIYLKGRPFDEEDINLDTLSDLTEGYIASDIAFIVNDAAMTAAFTRAKITQTLLEKTIGETKPSVTKDQLSSYDQIREKMEGEERRNSLPKIGFKKD